MYQDCSMLIFVKETQEISDLNLNKDKESAKSRSDKPLANCKFNFCNFLCLLMFLIVY